MEYLGPRISLARLIAEPEHSLVVQSYRPREMVTGTVNADGFGVGWYPDTTDEEPCLFTSPMPIWGDENLLRLGPKIHSRCIAASVRSATPGMPVGQEHCQPFAHGRYLFMHNGFVSSFRTTLMRRLRDSLRDESYGLIRGSSDSEHLFGLFLDSLHEVEGERGALARALHRTLDLLVRWVEGTDVELQLNCAVTDGRSLVACRFSNRPHAPSLYVASDEPYFPGGVLIASEPLLTNAHWRPVEKNHIVEIDGEREIVEPALAA